MSLGIAGPLDAAGGDLAVHYAISVTYLVHTGWLNKIAAACKKCGVELAKGEGTKTVIASGGPRPTEAYFCQGCVEWVRGSSQVVMERRIKDGGRE